MSEEDQEAFERFKRKKVGLRMQILACGVLPKNMPILEQQMRRVLMKHHDITPEEMGEPKIASSPQEDEDCFDE